MRTDTDFLIVGAGIVGLSIAQTILARHPDATVCILEKESDVGKHASGRNSGVLHSGIYYPEQSLKGQLCVEGAEALRQYCRTHDLPLAEIGKVVVPVSEADDRHLDLLYQRGKANGATVELIDASRLAELEPLARSASGRALHSPRTSVFDPLAILNHLAATLVQRGVQLLFDRKVNRIDPDARVAWSDQGERFGYGHLINTAGLHADRIARSFEVGRSYVLIPFKGLYYELSKRSHLRFNGLIYPVPDLNVPFLGVHFTKSISGKVYAGPTAIPALGRENYDGLRQVDWTDLPIIGAHLLNQYRLNRQGFRTYTHQEAFRFFKGNFVKAAKALVPDLNDADLIASPKVGIRPQLLHREEQALVMDFLIESGHHSTHILNAVSPAFTSAFAFARLVVEQYLNHTPPSARHVEAGISG